MNGNTTRARTGRETGSPRTGRAFRGAPVDGANALQVGYLDMLEPDTVEPDTFEPDTVGPDTLAPPRRHRPRIQPTQRPTTRPTARPARDPRPGQVAPPAPMALPRAPFLVLVVSLVIVGVLGVLVLNTKINENSFALDGLRGHQQALDLQEQRLTQDLEEAQSPGNLRAAAKRLGLVPAGTAAFITLPDGKIVGVPTPATAANPPAAGR